MSKTIICVLTSTDLSFVPLTWAFACSNMRSAVFFDYYVVLHHAGRRLGFRIVLLHGIGEIRIASMNISIET